MNRQEYMAWAKRRALEALESGDVQGAYMSMASDLGNNPETQRHDGIQLGMMQLMSGHLGTPEAMRKFIEGFN